MSDKVEPKKKFATLEGMLDIKTNYVKLKASLSKFSHRQKLSYLLWCEKGSYPP